MTKTHPIQYAQALRTIDIQLAQVEQAQLDLQQQSRMIEARRQELLGLRAAYLTLLGLDPSPTAFYEPREAAVKGRIILHKLTDDELQERIAAAQARRLQQAAAQQVVVQPSSTDSQRADGRATPEQIRIIEAQRTEGAAP